jgi:ubiquinone/menaquinone biosynthesis C-methylase UbiE
MKSVYGLQLLGITTLAISLHLGGCRNKDAVFKGSSVDISAATSVASITRTLTSDNRTSNWGASKSELQAQHAMHPPIDCPLHNKAGAELTHLRPFDDVEKYIAFLEKEDRATWQKPDEVVAALGLKGNETLVDVGAGSGYFTLRFAKALPRGRVIAADFEAEMIRHIHHRVMSDGIKNIQVVLTKPDDPEVTQDADWVFICDVLHHISDRSAWLGRIAAEMKSGAKLALIEFKEGTLPEGPPASAKISRTQLLSLASKAGLAFETEKVNVLPYQVYFVFRKP